jgi:predicted DNA-binding protein (MmcQ/YjbR family)
MNIEQLQQLCHTFPGTTADIKWEHDLCFCVAEKMYLILGPDNFPVSASFKVLDEEFEEMSTRNGFKPAPYLARYKWLHVSDIALLSTEEWKHYARQSYDLVYNKLPAKLKREIGSL